MRCGRFQSSGTAIEWRASNPKREDNLLVSTESDLSVQDNAKLQQLKFTKIYCNKFKYNLKTWMNIS